MKFWFRRRDSAGNWWSVYVTNPALCPDLVHAGSVCFGVAVVDCHRIYLNATLGVRHYPATLTHEWFHVEEWAHGVTRTTAKAHEVIDAAAVLAVRVPRTPPPVC